jgi:Acyl-CoA carboxylase epsilon subunit
MNHPAIRVERGNPTPEELAAIVAALLSQPAVPRQASYVPQPSRWATYWRTAQATPRPGGAPWRGSTSR